MADETPVISLKAIGTVRNKFRQPVVKHDWQNVISEIVVNPDLNEALDNLDEFSHLIILYWMHRRHPTPPPYKVHPRGNQNIPLKGLFATRSPNRPNSIGKTTVRLLQCRGNILKVQGLDAIDGTPVIDIKPYIPGYDSPADTRAPSWTDRDTASH
ncbi:tRNA (N6-threonylcarbamoyladenosine(37)-N6)-methyltransferase TrmO [Chloroflexota bacterium]